MLRKDREITDQKTIESIIAGTKVCRLAMHEDGWPYVVPLSFGYRYNVLYFHSAARGKKIEILKNNPKVCVEFDTGCEIVQADKPCKWGMAYQSVIGFGLAAFVDDEEEKRNALDIIMAHYGWSGEQPVYREKALKNTTVIKITIQRMTGKQAP